MKRTGFTFLVVAVAAIGLFFTSMTAAAEVCEKKVPTNPRALDCSFTISPNNAYFDGEGGTGYVNVSADPEMCEWDASTFYSWIDVSDTCS